MRRLKLELKQTMEMYSTACKEALTAKQKVYSFCKNMCLWVRNPKSKNVLATVGNGASALEVRRREETRGGKTCRGSSIGYCRERESKVKSSYGSS